MGVHPSDLRRGEEGWAIADLIKCVNPLRRSTKHLTSTSIYGHDGGDVMSIWGQLNLLQLNSLNRHFRRNWSLFALKYPNTTTRRRGNLSRSQGVFFSYDAIPFWGKWSFYSANKGFLFSIESRQYVAFIHIYLIYSNMLPLLLPLLVLYGEKYGNLSKTQTQTSCYSRSGFLCIMLPKLPDAINHFSMRLLAREVSTENLTNIIHMDPFMICYIINGSSPELGGNTW